MAHTEFTQFVQLGIFYTKKQKNLVYTTHVTFVYFYQQTNWSQQITLVHAAINKNFN